MKSFGQKALFFFFVVSLTHSLMAVVLVPNLPEAGVISEDNQGKMVKELDYENFTGRVTDKDQSGRILKIHVENNNTKFFRAGDEVLFKVNLQEKRDYCRAFVRGVEDFYFTIYVENFGTCYHSKDYFRRGTILNFNSKTLALRTFEATKYREQLIVRKQDFLKQLNDINHFVWSFDQQKVKTAAEFDEEINRIERDKRRALDELVTLKNEKLILQNELMKKLNELDEILKFYRVERQELLTDRWNMDHDAGLPFGQRPQKLKDN